MGLAYIFIAILLCVLHECEGDLALVQRPNCTSANAVYVCSANVSVILWRVLHKNYPSIVFIYNSAFDQVGTVMTNTIASSTVRVVLIFANSSSFTSSLSIEVTPELNSTIISCFGYIEVRKTLITSNSYDLASPVTVILTSQGHTNNAINLTATWSSVSANIDVNYNILVSPPPLYEVANRTTSNKFIKLSVRINTLYNVTIYTCTDITHSSYFLLGRCPFLRNFSFHSVIHYNISTTGSLTVVIRCTTDHLEYAIKCGVDGQWKKNPSDVCYSTSIISPTSTSVTATSVAASTTYNAEEYKMDLLLMIVLPVIASATILTCLLGLVIGIQLGFVSGFIYKKVMKENISNSTSHAACETVQSFPEVPLYEDIQMKQNLDFINVSHNISYGQIQ